MSRRRRRPRPSDRVRTTRRFAVGATLAAVAAAVLGIEPLHVLALLALIVSAAALWNTAPDDSPVELPATPGWSRDGTRRDVSQLAWAVHGRDRRVGERVIRRLRDLATTTLATHGVDLADPTQADRARALLGPSAHDALTDTTRMPTPRTAAAVMTTLEQLAARTPERQNHP
ncbi:hypothetical protein CLV28_1762 [Sediminihabitans luteus]|uniref:Uncharacterized protein n=1 Tax=Sediminihabitans luteus TaxID=1138585 RepID=A0A2M9CQZ9_9CELL|nr:hypothetical protein [Sediminihabitans luteus]PJJ74268.1 hypothetical protein CLV28_1762 [Sediminihabitans luteus]GII99121.1 hypothetical protein Slu03_14990 [Sediminihabitans luteus]